ncbi:hypothetical protein RUM44_008897 [Polyplax serrata]|uniref:DNA polymerase V n=1 Tax=Polyplax serrata TaxID=468196 RepID=A0ABR1AR75_POLSC
MDGDHVGAMMKNKKNANSIFTLFNNLTGENNQDPKFCVELVKTLCGEQFNIGTTNNFVYSIKRIVKALGSPRSHSQCGSFAALTCILKYGACSVEDVLNALDREQKSIHGATKSEIRALDTECVLACGAVIHSGLFMEQSVAVQQSIVTKLIEGGKKKSYLFTVACRFIIDIIQLSSAELFNETIWPICKTELLDNFSESSSSIEYFHLVTNCMIRSPKPLSKFLKRKSSSDYLFLRKLLNHLFGNSIKSTHPVYECAARLLCVKQKDLIILWSECVEENGNINNVKDNLLVTLFFHIMKYLRDASIVPHLLVPKFIDVLIKALTFKKVKTPQDNNSHAHARAALTSITDLLNKDGTLDGAKLETIFKLLLFPANMKFEMKTGTKIIQQLVSNLTSESTIKLLEIYKQVITDEIKKETEEGGKENWNSKEKQIALGNFVRTINHPSVRNDVPLKLEQIKFIFQIGFVTKNAYPLELKKFGKECFYKAVMLQMPTLKDLVLLLDELVMYVNCHIENRNLDISEEVLEWWNKQFLVVQKLRNDCTNKYFIALHVLLIYMGFQLFLDLDLAKGGIQELLSCYSHIKQVETLKRSKRGKNGKNVNSADELHWTEVTIDLILSLLSRENKLWRHVISCIFPQIVMHATPMALNQIIEALDPKSEKVVLEDVNSEGDDEDESESSGSETEDSELEDHEQEDSANDQLRMAVREALGYSAALTDDESVDMDQMNEEEEKRLNESLAEAFRMFKPNSGGRRKKQSKEEEALMHFRLRALDLVEIYILNNPSMEGCLNLILPLLNALEFSIKDAHQAPLRARLESIIKCLGSVKSFSHVENVTEELLKNLFQAVVNKKEISALVFVEMTSRISECTAFLVRCSQSLPEGECCLVTEYNSLLRAFFQARDLKLPISMFQSIMRITWKGCYKLIPTLFEFLSTPSVRVFKKMKIIELLQLFYKNEKLHSVSGEDDKLVLTKEEINFVETFNCFLVEYGKSDAKTSEKMYATFFSQIIMLINIIRNNTRKHRSSQMTRPPWEILVLTLAQISTVKENKKTRSQLVNLADLLNVVVNVTEKLGKKRKLGLGSKEENEREGEGGQNVTVEPKKKKKKLGRFNFKKESRKLREEGSSNGLKVFRFSSVNVRSLESLREEP